MHDILIWYVFVIFSSLFIHDRAGLRKSLRKSNISGKDGGTSVAAKTLARLTQRSPTRDHGRNLLQVPLNGVGANETTSMVGLEETIVTTWTTDNHARSREAVNIEMVEIVQEPKLED